MHAHIRSFLVAVVALLAASFPIAALAQDATPSPGVAETEPAAEGEDDGPGGEGEGEGEGAGEGEGEGEAEGGTGRIQILDDPEEAVGLALAGLTIVVVLLMLDNARRQLKGERPSTDGRWRPR